MEHLRTAPSIHTTSISFVIPVFNESEVLPLLIARLDSLCEKLEYSCEIIFVDDGSQDTSALQLLEAAATRPHYRLIRLSRNFGHQIAISAGIDRAEGSAVIVMDA
ncbi:MAG: glycosyltransferase, partial [Halocynthiibacter sp.]